MPRRSSEMLSVLCESSKLFFSDQCSFLFQSTDVEKMPIFNPSSTQGFQSSSSVIGEAIQTRVTDTTAKRPAKLQSSDSLRMSAWCKLNFGVRQVQVRMLQVIRGLPIHVGSGVVGSLGASLR